MVVDFGTGLKSAFIIECGTFATDFQGFKIHGKIVKSNFAMVQQMIFLFLRNLDEPQLTALKEQPREKRKKRGPDNVIHVNKSPRPDRIQIIKQDNQLQS